jgi:hypothetical protein
VLLVNAQRTPVLPAIKPRKTIGNMQSRRARPDSYALASEGTSLFVLLLCFSALHALPASVSPGASSIVSTCMTGPYPELCVHELRQRLQDIQTEIASAAPKQGARIAGAPGRGRWT